MKRVSRLFLCALISVQSLFGFKQRFFATKGLDLSYAFSANYRPESFFGKNIHLLNSCNGADVIWFSRHTIDLNIDVLAGQEAFGRPIIEFAFSARNKGVWGNPESIARTTDSTVKDLEVVSGKHRHAIPRHIFWMREGWLQFSIPDIFKLSFDHEHIFKIGFFPFELGRGIALGAAYAVGPEILGFYTNGAIDQFAPGALFSGELVTNRLSYDLYGAVLDNKMTSFGQTGEKILGQQVGRLACPQRMPGKVNYLFAGRFVGVVQQSDTFGKILFQPYWLFNNDPEQKIEFLGDATSKLATLGMAWDYYSSDERLAIGVEAAVNLGRQRVKAWDRNVIKKENRNGQVIIVNSQVKDQNGDKIVYVTDSDAQKIIDQEFLGCEELVECENGKTIGVLADGVGIMPGPLDLINSDKRYRNENTNSYKGWMVVGDISWWPIEKCLRLGFEAGAASGDDNPNFETRDCEFEGFIGLQEIYSGRSVRSSFVLGGAGRFPRPLSAPDTLQAPSKFAQSVDGFTNLVYLGGAATWLPTHYNEKFSINPNILAFWQHDATKAFDAKTKKNKNCYARKYLGTELNLFTHYLFYDNFKIFLVTSLFIPGGHYSDIKGKPLNSDQDEQLDQPDVTGFTGDRIPNIGDNVAFTFNLGLNFSF